MINSNNQVTFRLSDGFIEIVNNTLIIHDRTKKDRLFIFFPIIVLLQGIVHIYKWTQEDDNFQLVFGLILIILNLMLLWKWKRELMFIDNKISLHEISLFKSQNIILSDIKVGLILTKDKKYRRIKMDQKDLKEFSDYVGTRNIETITYW